MFREEFYKKRLIEYGDGDVRSLGWGSEQSQTTRFKILSEIGIKSGDSILDVGCGFGDFRKYLNLKDIKVKYTGIDTNRDFIETLQKENPSSTIFCEDISTYKQRDCEHDWVVASGVFCFEEPNWSAEVYKKIKDMLVCATKGVAINFLSKSLSPQKEVQPGFKHCFVEEVIEIESRT